ncbi:autotransporter assembly complex family protein [Candidatus Sororendozoicomonas aggregata]|uniref:autotransporter assembly complex protein TamA n=1 Tax=Candidatus Sororendozoicomonas aggregata TaxID=3073239 RepID=UPI002ED629A7
MKIIAFGKTLLLLALLFPLITMASPLKGSLEGIKGPLKENAALYLDALPDITTDNFIALRPRMKEEIQHALQALGYYQSSVVVHSPPPGKDHFTIDVTPGPATRIRQLTVSVLGEAKADPAFSSLLQKLPLSEGDVMNDREYESIKSLLSSLAAARGYFDARFTQHTVKVFPADHMADITLIFNAGARYRFGHIEYGKMSEPTLKLLKTMIFIEPGDPFDSVVLGKLNQNISSTGYFNRVNIHPLEHDSHNHQVPVFIRVKPKLNHEFEVGAGYSTDEGPRFSLNWDKPWINDHGHSLTNKLSVSAKTQTLTSSYKIPDGNPLQDFYDLQLGYQRNAQRDTSSTLVSTSIHRWFKRSVGDPQSWDQDIFFRVDYEDYTQSEQSDNQLLLIPGVSFSRRREKGGTDPYWGDQQLAKIELSRREWGSDTDFIKVWGRSKWLRTFASAHRIITRFEQGAIWVNDISSIPASLRFFAGGDQSIRGFSYDSISPRNSKDELTGAQYLTTASFEYNYSLYPKWRVAAFVDTGTATDNYNDKWKVGTGAGIRWITPLGQIKMDIAFAVSEPGSPWRIHFSMGPEI